MPDLRPVALIGLASAVAAIAPTRAFVRFEGTPALARPSVYAIAVHPDTVWFCATAPRDTRLVTYGFARRTREWRTVDGARYCTGITRYAKFAYDSAPLLVGAGVRIETRFAPRDSEGRGPRSTLRFVDSTRSLDIDLKPVLRPARIRSLLRRVGSVDADTTSIGIGGVSVNDSLAWIGLAGGFPEGEGSLGGIYRIDRRTGAWKYILDTTLAWHTVTGLAQTRDWLWAGTEAPGEYGSFGHAGLRRMDLRTGTWRDFTAANSPVPDALIVQVAGDERAVAVATQKGLAVIELRTNGASMEIARWNTRYFIPTFVGDSLGVRIGPRAEAVPDSTEAAYIFAQEFGARGRERAVFRQLRQVPARLTQNALNGFPERIPEKTLANPSLAPILTAMLSASLEAKGAVGEAVKQLGARTPPSVRVAVRDEFIALDTAISGSDRDLQAMVALAGALRASGDSTAIHWARAQLDKTRDTTASAVTSQRINVVEAAANIAAESRDSTGLSFLLMNVGVDPNLDKNLMGPLARYDSPRAWQALVSIVERRHAEVANTADPGFYWREALRLSTPGAFADSATAARLKAYLHLGLTGDSPYSRESALYALVRARLPGFGADLVQALADSVNGRLAYTALVSLYGRADAPKIGARVPTDAIAWWRTVIDRDSPSVVARLRGEKALADWTRAKAKR